MNKIERGSTQGNGEAGAKKPLKPASLNRFKAHLSAIYQYGKLRDKVHRNPARDVKQRRMKNGVIRWLKPEEEKRLRDTLMSWIETKSHLGLYQEPWIQHRLCELDIALGTSMRKGEQYGPKWGDIDCNERMITLRGTKNGESRIVHMIDDVVAAFKRVQDFGLNRREGRTHPTRRISAFAIGDNKKWWAQAMKDANIENFRWHDLRHTFCSRLAQRGVGLKVTQEAAGHKTTSMSVRYAHMDQSSLRSALGVLNRPSA